MDDVTYDFQQHDGHGAYMVSYKGISATALVSDETRDELGGVEKVWEFLKNGPLAKEALVMMERLHQASCDPFADRRN